jgi:hypothetical protein
MDERDLLFYSMTAMGLGAGFISGVYMAHMLGLDPHTCMWVTVPFFIYLFGTVGVTLYERM